MEYFSEEEKARLEERLRGCLDLRRALAKRLEAARELGDLRENADYHATKEELAFNEAKIRELEGRLKLAVVTDQATVPPDMVFVGATVRLREVASGAEEVYRLVGATGGSLDDDMIEVTPNSPLGEALMKARVGDTVRVTLRRGPKRFEIMEILGD